MNAEQFSGAGKQPQLLSNMVWLGALLSLCYLALFTFQARVDIQLQEETSQGGFFRLYWAGPDQGFSEERMAYAELRPEQQDYFLHIGSLSNIERIRIDPIDYAGKFHLLEFRLSQWSWRPLILHQLEDYGYYRGNDQIRIQAAASGIQIETLGDDGHFEIDIQPRHEWTFPLQHLLNISAIWLGLGLLMIALNPLLPGLRFVVPLLSIALLLVALMAIITDLNMHPDEVVHLEAVRYYAGHLLPPALDDTEIASSYSVYGHSRLSDYEIYYQLAGYFQALPALLGASPLFGARSFGLLLFLGLIIFAVLRPAFRPFTLPLLVSAQAWYLFSYTNSDGFALALSLLVAYMAASPGSLLNRFLNEERCEARWGALLVLGLLFGSLLLLKANYYFFILFLLGYLAWRLAYGDFADRSRLFGRLALLALVALCVFGVRVALDVHANGWNPDDIKMQMAEQYAAPEFNPGTPLEDKNPMLALRERGYSAGYTFIQARWFEKTFQSSFGVYGFSEYFASKSWYDLVRYVALALIVILFIAALRNRQQGHLWLLLLLGLCGGGLLLASAWHSWNDVFQPQGRYLLPVLPMFSILYFHIRDHAPPGLIECLCILLFILAGYSFVDVGLINMGGILSD